MARFSRWACVLLAATLGLSGLSACFAAEREGAMTAVMQIDMSGINEQIKGLQDQITKLTEELTALKKAVTDMNASVTGAVGKLAPSGKWEYKVLRSTSEEALNDLGAEGWEAVAGFKEVLVLKRAAKPAKIE